jgi:aminoacrylate hydrolase
MENAMPLEGPSLAVILTALAVSGCAAQIGAPPDARKHIGYAQVDDIRIHYESRGTGIPVLLLHGGFGTAELWSECGERLSARYRVVAPDARGRGRTGDGDGPMSAGRTARDVIGLMDQLGIARAHLVGHSQASLTVIHLLVDYPDRVLSGALVGSPMMSLARPNAALKALRANIDALRSAGPVDDPDLVRFAARWRELAPQPDRFEPAMEKFRVAIDATYSEAALGTIRRPVLVVKAGRDNLIDAADFDRLAAAIPGARVADFPDGTHGLPRQAAVRLAEAIERFIESQERPR